MTSIMSGGRPVASRKEFPYSNGYQQTSGPSAGFMPLLRADGASTTFDGMYRNQPMIYAVVSKLITAGARIPIKAYEFGADGDTRRRVRGSDLERLLRSPHTRGSSYALKAAIHYSLRIHGQALLLKVRPAIGAEPTELWHVPWRYVTVTRDERGPLAYAITIGAETYPLGPEDVVHFDPLMDCGGAVSPLEPLRRTLALDDAALTYQAQALANGANGGRVVFKTDQKVTPDAMGRLREELSKIYTGSENAGRPIVVDQGLDAKSLFVSAADMELSSQRTASREEVCATYDMPPALMGWASANYGSMIEHRRALYDSLASTLTLIEDTLQAQLVDPEPAWDGLFIEHDTGELLRVDLEARARAHMMLLQAGVETRNEARMVENLPPIEDPLANTIFVPLNMAPLDGSGAMPTSGSTAGTPAQGLADRVTTVDPMAASLLGDPAGNLGGEVNQ